MNEHEITTAHNVKLRLSFASIGHRILGAILDLLIKAGYLVAASIISSIFISSPLAFTPFWVLLVFILGFPVIFYSLFFEYLMAGQTPGKRVMKIRVASLKNDQLTFGQCLIRWLFRIADFNILPGIGIIAAVITEKKQRIGDLMAGTIVVNIKPEKTLDQTIYTNVETDRTVINAQVGSFTPREIEVIKEVLRLYQQEGNYDLIPVTAARVRTAMGTTEDGDDLGLLQGVVADYYAIAAS
jgi:uncharacterized RDD family membrane protein YckC